MILSDDNTILSATPSGLVAAEFQVTRLVPTSET